MNWLKLVLLVVFVGGPACVEEPEPGHDRSHNFSRVAQQLVDCTERQDTGYTRGTPTPITVVTVDGKPVERDTANAFYVMQQAAAAQGVAIGIVSGFRTQAQQQYLYNCYINQNCNNGNLAARPGYSNHQSGHALDLNTSAPGVYNWLAANGGAYGFKRTVSSEPWHWEWWGGGPGGGICGVCEPSCKDGDIIVDRNCNEGSCGAFGSRCVDDEVGVRCAFVFCPDQGTADVCLDEATIGHCNNGAIETGDCSAFASVCTTATGAARCASAFCVDEQNAPIEQDGCFFDGTIAHCDANGGLTTEACAAGQHCSVWPEIGCTDTPVCPSEGEVTVCADEAVVGHCNFGSLMEAEQCGDQGSLCVEHEGSARCVPKVCISDGAPVDGDVCLEDGSVATCTDGEVVDVRRCPEGESCTEGACEVAQEAGAELPSSAVDGTMNDPHIDVGGRTGCSSTPGPNSPFTPLALLGWIVLRHRIRS